MKYSRRTLIKAGLAGQLLLGVGSLRAQVVRQLETLPASEETFLTPADRHLYAKLIPEFLGDAWSLEQDGAALSAMINAIEEIILGLTPSVQVEVRELLDLLAIKPVRYLLTGIYHIENANSEQVQAWLVGWQSSRFTLLRTAFKGLHQPIMGAWYGQPASWADIGYPGPPPLVRPQ